jgi:serine/threonine protein kinase
MDWLLQRGQMVVARGMQSACVVHDLLGEGAQAEVYRARVGAFDYALKWYRPEYLRNDPRLWDRLKEAINSGSPCEQFLWPFDLVSLPRTASYAGYLMPVKPPGFVSLVDLVRRQSEPSFRSLATVAFLLAESFFRLHAAGLCYRDINFGNIFFQPDTGDIRIGDTDNVDVNGRPGSIMGTPGFIAPEVGRRKADPNAMTDRFSLAVMLFYIFMLGHPLKGKLETDLSYDANDPDGSRRLCFDNPIFVFDPTNLSNRPVPGVHDVILNFWPIYPQSLRDLFTRSFTIGLSDPDERVMENEWRKEMCRLRDAIFYCPQCTAENFMDIDLLRRKVNLNPCWSCEKQLAPPPRMRIAALHHDPSLVALSSGVRLYPHHLEGDTYNFSTPLAEVTGNPLGLKNLSSRNWTGRNLIDTGAVVEVPPGGILPVQNGFRISFGQADGEVRL